MVVDAKKKNKIAKREVSGFQFYLGWIGKTPEMTFDLPPPLFFVWFSGTNLDARDHIYFEKLMECC